MGYSTHNIIFFWSAKLLKKTTLWEKGDAKYKNCKKSTKVKLKHENKKILISAQVNEQFKGL